MRLILVLATTTVVYAFSAGPLLGQVPVSSDGLWQAIEIKESATQAADSWKGIQSYRLARLDQAGLHNVLTAAPAESVLRPGLSPAVMTIPMPNGTFQRFQYVESPVMAPELAAKYPDMKTYLGQGLDDPHATARFDWTPAGFHAHVLSPSGSVIVDPYVKGKTDEYISFYQRDVSREATAWTCFTDDHEEASLAVAGKPQVLGESGDVLRTYRIAVAADAEYTAYKGGVTQAMASIVTIVNRVSGVYEQEFCIRLQLVANNDLLIYTNASTDPYNNESLESMLSQNQTNLNAVIGSANYDLGHVLGTRASGAGGLSYVGVVCLAARKAMAGSQTAPWNDESFTMQIIIHEMGHQFGSHHSWNGVNGGCSASQWDSGTACEPGSGSTIMAYPGSCGADNIQSSTDPYFHAISYKKIRANIVSGLASLCDVETSTTNSIPSVTVPASYTIPIQTPFTLTAAGGDPDGDPITYCWEEMDLGPRQALADPDNGESPIFRSWPPTTDPSRTFPRLSNLLNNTLPLGEQLPSTDRTLVMRCTVRDNRAGCGGVTNADTTLTVTTSAGPFAVTSPNSAVTWWGTRTVTWNVNNTHAAPVNCSGVNIRMSADGGYTYPYLLASNTPNDGIQSVNIPAVITSKARIKVEAVGNVFFDVSNVNFSTICSTPGIATDVTASDGTDTHIAVTWTLPVGDPFGLSHCEIWRNTTNDGATARLIADQWTTTAYQDSSCSPGETYYYWIKMVNLCGTTSAFSAYDSGWCILNSPTNVAATDGTSTSQINVTWTAPSGGTHYRVFRHTANDSAAATAISAWQTTTFYSDSTATPGGSYYYWVKAAAGAGGEGAGFFSAGDSGWRALSAPAAIVASDGEYTNGVEVAVPVVEGAAYYQFYRSLTSNSSQATALGAWQTNPSLFDTTAVPSRDYYYWAKAAMGSSGERAGAFSLPNAGWRGLSPPANLAATDGTDDSRVLITWDSTSAASHYRVYRNSTNTFATATALGTWQMGRSYSDDASYGVDFYYWVVAAADEAGARPSKPSTGDVGWRALPPPGNLVATDGDFTDRVHLTWDASGGGAWYRLHRGTSALLVFSDPVTDWVNNLTAYDDRTAKPGTTYYYWVRVALDDAGTRASDATGPSSGWRALTGPNAEATYGTYVDRVEVSWKGTSSASHYRVYRGTASTPLLAAPVSKWQAGLTFADTTAVEGVGYFYWVQAATSADGDRASAFGKSAKGALALDCNDNGVPDQDDPDADDDGVPDGCDQCPNTVPDSPVDASGCPPAIPADFDRDGDVDADDLAAFEACVTGPATGAVPTGCANKKLDGDDDIDQSDFGIFQRCYSGAQVPADPNCAD